jgi:hypothetical protein
MPDMLPVAAGQISHPITGVILMEPDNRLVHAASGHSGIRDLIDNKLFSKDIFE